MGWTEWWSIHLVYGEGGSFAQGETHLQRGRLVYRGWETRSWSVRQGTGDKEQRRKTGDIGWEPKYKTWERGQRTWDRDGWKGQRNGWHEEERKNSENACGVPKWFFHMLSLQLTNFYEWSANELPIFTHDQPTSNQFLHMLSQRITNFHAYSA